MGRGSGLWLVLGFLLGEGCFLCFGKGLGQTSPWPLLPWTWCRHMDVTRFPGTPGGACRILCIDAYLTLLWSIYAQNGGSFRPLPNLHCRISMALAGFGPARMLYGWMPGFCYRPHGGSLLLCILAALTLLSQLPWLIVCMLHALDRLWVWMQWIDGLIPWTVQDFLRALEGARRLLSTPLTPASLAAPWVPLVLLIPWLCLRWLSRLTGCFPLNAVSTELRVQFELLRWSASDACLALDPLAWTPWHVFRLLPWLILMMRSLLWTGLRRRWALWRIRPLRLPADSSAPTG